jgi:MSHA biogenesis protein MshM
MIALRQATTSTHDAKDLILAFFDLSDQPFALTPNPHLFFPWDHPHAVLQGAEFTLQRGDGLLKISGAIGSGKTLLCRLLLDRLEASGCNTAYLNAPVVEPRNLPLIVAREFGITPTDHLEPYRDLREFLLRETAHGKRNILVIDEAQALGSEGLEIIRLLSNLETEIHKLLQIVLFGQAELDALLARPELRQIAQRISFAFTTKPLPAALVPHYVGFRLQRSTTGYRGSALFTPKAMELLAYASRGWPRLINLLADKALLAAYAAQAPQVQPKHLRAAIADSPHLALSLPWRYRFLG